MKSEFLPSTPPTISRGRLVELLNELDFMDGVLEDDDPLCTDEFLQEMADDWWDFNEDSGLGELGPLWEDDEISEVWQNKIREHFKTKL